MRALLLLLLCGAVSAAQERKITCKNFEGNVVAELGIRISAKVVEGKYVIRGKSPKAELIPSKDFIEVKNKYSLNKNFLKEVFDMDEQRMNVAHEGASLDLRLTADKLFYNGVFEFETLVGDTDDYWEYLKLEISSLLGICSHKSDRKTKKVLCLTGERNFPGSIELKIGGGSDHSPVQLICRMTN